MNFFAKRTLMSCAFQASSSSVRLTRFVSSVRLLSTTNDGIFSDTQGRRIRQRGKNDDNDDDWGAGSWNNDDNDDWSAPQRNRRSNNSNKNQRNSGNYGASSGGWDDFDPFEDRNDNFNSNYQSKPRRRQPSSRGAGYGERSGGYRERQTNKGGGNNNSRDRRNGPSRFPRRDKEGKRSINMNALEGAGFVHLYGLSSVLNALKADRRDLETSVEKAVDEWGETESEEVEPPKPETQFRPFLFVQARGASTRKGQKASAAEEVMALAEERNVPIAEVDKGVLNALSGNRPHQGFVLRCGQLDFEPLSRIPFPDDQGQSPSTWLVLDEVVDPQNLGALLRSAYFLGGGRKVGVLVCSKNSAPPTPVVSAASAGALEVLTVYSTSNLPKTLNQAGEDGFRIIGASSSVPKSDGEIEPRLYDLQDLPAGDGDEPVLLVLGSEGHGLRTLVAKGCSEFVRIPAGLGGEDAATDVDSLNVSVTGGILLWHILNNSRS